MDHMKQCCQIFGRFDQMKHENKHKSSSIQSKLSRYPTSCARDDNRDLPTISCYIRLREPPLQKNSNRGLPTVHCYIRLRELPL